MSDTKTLMTAAEFSNLPDDGFRYELVKGVLRRMAPAGGEHGVRAMDFGVELGYYVHIPVKMKGDSGLRER